MGEHKDSPKYMIVIVVPYIIVCEPHFDFLVFHIYYLELLGF